MTILVEQPARDRTMAALFVTAALMNAAMAAASPISTIVAADRGGTAWSALPNTAGIVGTGVGALALTRMANRRGWRRSSPPGTPRRRRAPRSGSPPWPVATAPSCASRCSCSGSATPARCRPGTPPPSGTP